MSYSCFISFKKMDAKDIISFLREYKKATTSKLREIAKENHSYCPYIRDTFEPLPPSIKDVSLEKNKEAKAWARNVFSYRYFYDTDNNMLCMFGIPSCMRELFDATIYFQNSCDQDYERETWEGVQEFTDIYDRWFAKSDEEIMKTFKEENDCDFLKSYSTYKDKALKEKLDYYRKSYAYDEIWNRLSDALYDDDSAIYFSLYGGYDISAMTAFVKYCHEEHIIWEKEFEEQWNAKHGNKE